MTALNSLFLGRAIGFYGGRVKKGRITYRKVHNDCVVKLMMCDVWMKVYGSPSYTTGFFALKFLAG